MYFASSGRAGMLARRDYGVYASTVAVTPETIMKGTLSLIAVLGLLTAADAAETKRTPKEALQAFHDLIGGWRGTGVPQGTREEKERGFWQEHIRWKWQFKDKDVWLRA